MEFTKVVPMITLECGRKLKVKSSSSFFGKEVYLTKMGWVCGLGRWRSNIVFPSRFEMEEAIIAAIRAENKEKYTWAFLRKGCMSARRAKQEWNDWSRGRVTGITWFNQGGLAVAVKLDSLGLPVDYLSLDEWSNKHNWSLPPGDWHMFRS